MPESMFPSDTHLANYQKLLIKQQEDSDYHLICSCGKSFDGPTKKEVVANVSTHWKEIHGVAKIEDATFAAVFKMGNRAVVDNIYIQEERSKLIQEGDASLKSLPHDEEEGDQDDTISPIS